jgi:addiction module RelE/StbE family toxin
MTKLYRVVVPPTVKRDLKEIVEYYHEINRSYAKRLFDQLVQRMQELKTFPEKGRVVPELRDQNIADYKELIEENYRIVYRVAADEVQLLAILDSRRNVEDILIRKLKRK